MSDTGIIKTPWHLQWRRIRYQVFPVLVLTLTALTACWLWTRHAGMVQATGEMLREDVDATTQANGLLVALPRRQLELYDVVKKDQVIARLDERPIVANLATLKAEVARLRAELPTRQVAPGGQVVAIPKDVLELEALRLQVVEKKAQEELTRIEAEQAKTQEQVLTEQRNLNQSTDRDLMAAQVNRERVEGRLKIVQSEREDAEAQLLLAEEKLKLPENKLSPEHENILNPIRALASLHEARILKLTFDVQELDIRAPIAGQIIAINRRPGQTVTQGDAIMTIANGDSRHIVTYIRADQRVRLEPGASLWVRPQFSSDPPIEAKIISVGPHAQAVPPRQLRNAQIPEWGVPVLIQRPPGLVTRPGDLVELRFESQQPTLQLEPTPDQKPTLAQSN